MSNSRGINIGMGVLEDYNCMDHRSGFVVF
jgi:hypothetical protein